MRNQSYLIFKYHEPQACELCAHHENQRAATRRCVCRRCAVPTDRSRAPQSEYEMFVELMSDEARKQKACDAMAQLSVGDQ